MGQKSKPWTAPEAGEEAAVIDIGANSVRAVMYRVEEGRFYELDSIAEKPKLGRGVHAAGRLQPRRIQKTLNALEALDIAIDCSEISRRIAFATAAVREADEASRRTFLSRAETVIGTEIHVLSGGEEGWCAARGVIAGGLNGDGLVADLGGLSLELALIRDGAPHEGVTAVVGPLAIETVLEQAGLEAARDRVRTVLSDSAKPQGGWSGHQRLYGVGGAWRALANADISRKSGKTRRGRPHGYTLPLDDARTTIALLLSDSSKAESVLDKARVDPERRETLKGSLVALEILLEKTGVAEIVISGYGVREGVLARALNFNADVRALAS